MPTIDKRIKSLVETTWQEIQDHISHEPMTLGQIADFEQSCWENAIAEYHQDMMREIRKQALSLYDETYHHGEQEDGSTTYITEKEFDTIIKSLKHHETK